jgi:hypothetical protein
MSSSLSQHRSKGENKDIKDNECFADDDWAEDDEEISQPEQEHPPPYHILPRGSYLIIPQVTPDLLRWDTAWLGYGEYFSEERQTSFIVI